MKYQRKYNNLKQLIKNTSIYQYSHNTSYSIIRLKEWKQDDMKTKTDRADKKVKKV